MTNNTRKAEKFKWSCDLGTDYVEKHLGRRYIFPIKPSKKFPPLIRENLRDASNDPVQIEAWAKKWPGCNFGVALFKSNLMVADVDVNKAKGKVGQATYDDLDLMYSWPETEKTTTPSGGWHMIYKCLPGQPHVMALGENGIGKDVDCPNYLLIPGCTFDDGTSYTTNGLDAAPCPQWLYDTIKSSKTKSRITDAGEIVVELDQQSNIDLAIDFLKNDAEPSIQGSGGDFNLLKAAYYLKDIGISQQLGADLLNEYFNPRCEPAWDLDDLAKKMAGAYSYANLSKVGGKTAEADFADDVVEPFEPMGDPKTIARQRAERLDAKADKEPERDLQTIDCTDMSKLPRIARRVQRLVIKSAFDADAKPADQVFQRAGSLVHLSRNRLKPGTETDKKYHVENELLINTVEDGWLADRLERGFTFYRMGKKKGASGKSEAKALPINVPRPVVERLQSIKQDWAYPNLIGTVETPTLRADGTVLDVPGYDEKSGLYFDPGLATFPEIEKRPTKKQCLAALEILMKPLADFPFADEDGVTGLSRSVALAMLLTSVCRRSLSIAPMFGIDANEAQSGKTELAQVAAIMMTGRRTGARPLPMEEYQRSNALAAAFEAGDAAILYDNIDGDKQAVEGEALCMALTEGLMTCRRLGGNSAEDQIKAPTNALIMGTGNKLTAAGDMAEDRMLICNLRTDKPLSKRKFAHWPLDEYVIGKRPTLVAAALTILRGYQCVADRKPGPNFRFSQWRSVVADALVWLGETDPTLSTRRVKADDPVKDTMRDVMRAWARYIGEAEVTTASLITSHPDVWRAIADARKVTDTRLSKEAAARYLKGMVGIDLLGYKLTRQIDPHDEITRWSAKLGTDAERIPLAPGSTDVSEAVDEFADLM
jgi:hypothetical protein